MIIRQVNKMHRRQSAILGLIPSILLMTAVWSAKLWTAFSHYSRGNRNGQDLVCLLSLLLRTIRTAGISSWGRRQSRSSSAIVREGRPDWTRDDEAEELSLVEAWHVSIICLDNSTNILKSMRSMLRSAKEASLVQSVRASIVSYVLKCFM